ncbi:4-hydroxy-3-methylbut-2-enyl diphosphate reductase [Sanyastnella coralliicola]|uniref:4-hydroxy-3-methylbut-2-enyl diphosphate reductase n=1 Tax=Sanyastnella coralliicola TaxID=3069118 RepID=UPI0027B979D4|nr:4-hydroxy-3-methylbut-2-enyl diphosphate reductase [Longitalea sp. SCSIO 12813]
MRSFDIPTFYRSPIISRVKAFRKAQDPKKKDFSPTELDFGPVKFMLARHFGFCYGVENAIEISYKALNENPGKQIYLLSQMIHNPSVNADLTDRGIKFLQDTYGNELIPFDQVTTDDVVIIPAFGTTVEVEAYFRDRGIEVQQYNTTCPFVEKVWNRSAKLGQQDCTIIIHGKPKHEETRATFSHARENAAAVVVKDMDETKVLEKYIRKELPKDQFYKDFEGQYSEGFDPDVHFNKIGVVNQTTMLASDTQAIADHLKQVIIAIHGEENMKQHFADTRDTLCYATNDNQQATYGLLEKGADLAIVVGGYNSSNTSHLVELCEEKMPTFFIQTEEDILNRDEISHFDIHTKEVLKSSNYLPSNDSPTIIVTSGASCPDAIVDRVIAKLLSYFDGASSTDEVIAALTTVN